MKNDLEEKKVHGTQLFPFQYYHARTDGAKLMVPYHWHDNVEIFFVEAGEFSLMVEGCGYSGHEGECFFFNPGQLHQLSSVREGSTYFSFVFSLQSLDFRESDYVQTTLLDPLRQEWQFPLRITTEESCYPALREELWALRTLSEEKPPVYQLLIKVSLYRIIALLEQNHLFVPWSRPAGKEQSPTSTRLKKLLQYVALHYRERIPLEKAAAIMHMSPKYFCSYFTATFYISFVQYLNRYRIEQACVLLETTDLSVMEVGFEVGFENFSYFIRKFKEIQGCTPSVYRKQSC